MSSQTSVHESLELVVRKHQEHPWQHSVRAETRETVVPILQSFQDSDAPLVLDVGCGTGLSSVHIADTSGCHVLAVDQSQARLTKAPAHSRVTYLRADAADIWCLANELSFCFAATYILYPNPWPKPKHLKRRWHGHPVFPQILSTAHHLVLRTNWDVYAQEWQRATTLLGSNSVLQELHLQAPYVSRFEEKYARSRHNLFEVLTNFKP